MEDLANHDLVQHKQQKNLDKCIE